jgi:hypothetical protein
MTDETDAPPSESEFLNRWVPKLPQFRHIREDDALAWREQVLAIDPMRFRWHFRRLFGIGGSEIGEIVAHGMDEPCQFQTPREIALSKLMRRAPSPQDPILRRGVLMEPVIRQVFHEDFDVKPLDQERFAIESYRDTTHPWMRGNLDDFVRYEGVPTIADYKAPGNPRGEVPLLYVCQLHHYGHLYIRSMAAAGHKVAPPRLVNVRFHYRSGCAQPHEVPWSEEIHTAVLEAGDGFWRGVLNGEVPEWTARTEPDLDLDPAEQAQLMRLEDHLLRALLLREAAESARTTIGDQMRSLVTRDGARLVKGFKPDLTGLTMGVRRSVDEERYPRLLAEYPGVERELVAFTKKWDAEAMAERLAELGEDPQRYRIREPDPERVLAACAKRGIAPAVSETVFFSVSRKKTVAEPIERARASAVEVAQAAMARIGEEEDFVAADEIESPDDENARAPTGARVEDTDAGDSPMRVG